MSKLSKTPLKIWGRSNSFNVQKVMWLIGELDIPHEHIPAGGSYGGLNSAEFLKMNPHGKIPVISDGGHIVWESHNILRYLAAKYGEHHWFSNDLQARSQVECWMDWSQTSLQPDFLQGIFWGYYRTPEAQRDWQAINASIQKCNTHFKLLNELLKNNAYLCGNQITLADIPTGTHLYRYFELDIEKPSLPFLEQWYQKLQERPAYQQHVMIPFNDLYGRLTF